MAKLLAPGFELLTQLSAGLHVDLFWPALAERNFSEWASLDYSVVNKSIRRGEVCALASKQNGA
jgi:hypothetical protein